MGVAYHFYGQFLGPQGVDKKTSTLFLLCLGKDEPYKIHTMNTFLTKAILILLLSVAAVPCLAQPRGAVSFNYDANGNRIARFWSFQKDEGVGRSFSGLQEGPTDELATPMLASATDELAGLRLTLYPNPTEGHFSVGVGNAVEGTRLQAVLCTSAGVVVSRKALSGDRIDFDLSGHAAGVYVLRLEAGEETRTWKVIKH